MKSSNKREMIVSGNLYKVIITLALPIMFNNLIQTLYSLINTFFLAKLGDIEFTATSFVWPIQFLFISVGMGIAIAGTSILSQLLGAGKHEEANRYTSQLVVLSFVGAIIFAAIGFLISPLLVSLMGATGDLHRYGSLYLRITFFDLPFMFFYFNFNSIMNAQGNTLTPTILSALSAVVNAVLDPLLIFGLKFGVAGAAFATLTTKALLAFAAMYILYTSTSVIKPKLRGFRFDGVIIKQVLRIGIPSSIGQSGAAMGFIFLNGFIVSFGTTTLAAFSIVNRITSLISQPAMGIGAALTAVVGQNLGAGKAPRVKEAFRKAILLTMCITVTGSLLMLWKDHETIRLFLSKKSDISIFQQSVTYLQYILISMPLMGIFSVFQGVFQGSGHTKYSMSMEIGRLWVVRLPMILMFKYLTDIGSVGIWFSMSFSNVIVCLYGYAIYRRGNWQKKILR